MQIDGGEADQRCLASEITIMMEARWKRSELLKEGEMDGRADGSSEDVEGLTQG